MNKNILEIFQNYSFLSDETIYNNILKKLKNKKLLKEIYLEVPEFLKHIDIQDITHTLNKLETNLTIIDHALEEKDNELLFHLRMMNQQNMKLLNELYVMLENRELK